MADINPDVLKRYAEGKCTVAEQHVVEDWLENDHNLPEINEQPEILSLKNEIWTGLIAQAVQNRTSFKLRRGIFALVAASLLIFVVTLFFRANPSDQLVKQVLAQQTYQAPKGKMVSLKLNDGTIVQLSGGSSFRYPLRFSGQTREVTLLSGEAFFQVKHNKQQPFILHSSGTEIKVLGTRFNVSNTEGTAQLAVTLTEGSISFKGKKQPETILKPGQQLTFNKASNQVQKIEEVDTLYATGWTVGLLWFKKVPLTEVLQKLETYYGVTFEIHGHPDVDIHLTGKFIQQPLSRILKLIENSSELKFEQQHKKIIIYKANQPYNMNNKGSPG